MEYTDTAIETLRAAEFRLREIIGEALREKAYSDVAKIASLANSVAALINELTRSEPAEKKATAATSADGHLVPRTSATTQPTLPHSRSSASRRGSYPRFLRDGDRLVKVAWSKKERKPYEHRAPQHVIQTFIEAVRKRKGEGKLFEATDVLPLSSPNGEEYPSYQSYLALAWLRHVGIVAKRGREGYVLKPGAASPDALATLWASLPVED